MKQCLILLSLFLIITGCQNEKRITVNGTINNTDQKYIYLSRLDVETAILIDSAAINKTGRFRFKIKAGDPDFYKLGFNNNDFITILSRGGEKIRLTFNGNSLYSDYTVTGSPESDQVRTLNLSLQETKRKLDSLRNVYNIESGKPGFETRGPAIEAEFISLVKEQRKENIEFIVTNIKSMASIVALYQKLDDNTYVLYEPRDLQYLKIVSDSLSKYYPNSRHVKALVQNLKTEMDQLYSKQIKDLMNKTPETILDPDLKDINGKRISLSSLRGKVVLLTFWSVSSKECISENLQLKTFYENYKTKGFEIYQINLDEDEEEWKRAVRFDELPWISTREDDPSSPKYAKLYNVKSLPANYLYDAKGNIIASNIHNRNLQIKLNQLFNN